MDGITRSGGSSSRRMLMPSGTTATAAPWSARPAISTGSRELMAQSSEPTTIDPSASSSTRRLPYMSPARPSNGVNTAPVSRVTVTSQLTLLAAVGQPGQFGQQRHDDRLGDRDQHAAGGERGQNQTRVSSGTDGQGSPHEAGPRCSGRR